MVNIVIRDASRRDVPALIRLMGQLDPPSEAPGEAAARAALRTIARQPGMRLAVAVADNEVVGAVTLAILPNLSHHAQPWAQLENLVVDKAHRSRGVGRALMAWCEDTARAAGCYKLQFQSRNGRRHAHRFYRRLGYRARTVGFRRYLNGVPPAV